VSFIALSLLSSNYESSLLPEEGKFITVRKEKKSVVGE
jgi:hypothetical protein